jgi:hypothetical protein
MTATESTTLTDEQRANIDGLRDLVDWYEQHPEYMPSGQQFLFYVSMYDGDVREQMAAAARALGTADKNSGGDYFRLVRRFGPVELCIYADRDRVCERRVVGVETVDSPDPVAVKEAIAALPTAPREVEIVEWVCPDSILRGAVSS